MSNGIKSLSLHIIALQLQYECMHFSLICAGDRLIAFYYTIMIM